MSYAFGDSDLAAERLRCLASVFAPSTRDFVAAAVRFRPALTVDLGCGPGASTHCLAEVLRGARIIGIDSSPHFIAMARSSQSETVTFCQHDFTATPFPCGHADLLYGRYVLTHVADPDAVVRGWATQILPGGLLLMEETEQIHTSQPAFATYLRIVEGMLAHQRHTLYIGPQLDGLSPPPGLRRGLSRVATFPVRNRDVARMFWLNIKTWRHNPYILQAHSTDEIDQLEQELEALLHADPAAADSEWGLRQLVFQRA